jgi:hypothetical protein
MIGSFDLNLYTRKLVTGTGITITLFLDTVALSLKTKSPSNFTFIPPSFDVLIISDILTVFNFD